MTPRAVSDRKRKHEAMLQTKCLDCREVTTTSRASEYYMVHDDLWKTANADVVGMICVGCLEKRIGRQLNPLVFSDCPLNHYTHGKSERLTQRQKPTGDMIMANKAITGMFEVMEALESVIESSDVSKRKALAAVLDAYAKDFPDEFFWRQVHKRLPCCGS